MKDVALFLAGAGSTLAAVLYVLALQRNNEPLSDRADGDWPAVPGDFPFHSRKD